MISIYNQSFLFANHSKITFLNCSSAAYKSQQQKVSKAFLIIKKFLGVTLFSVCFFVWGCFYFFNEFFEFQKNKLSFNYKNHFFKSNASQVISTIFFNLNFFYCLKLKLSFKDTLLKKNKQFFFVFDFFNFFKGIKKFLSSYNFFFITFLADFRFYLASLLNVNL